MDVGSTVRRAVLMGLVALPCACNDVRSDRGAEGGAVATIASAADDSGVAQGTLGGDGDGDAGPDSGADDGPLDGTGASVFDVGGPSGGGETGPVINDDECQKIDFLFVIDNSGSMFNEQQALVSSFPGFIAAIQQKVNAQNYQIMVVDTDAAHANLCTDVCMTLPNCFGTPCNSIPTPTVCDETLGAGVTKSSAGLECGVTAPDRFMVDAQPDVGGTFACMGKVGITGQDVERPMDAMVEAVTSQAEPGACNQGFLRDDAILVVTFITDEEDDGDSLGDPASWKQALVAAKAGNEAAVVVLGLVGDPDVMGGTCGPLGLAEPSPRLRTFAESLQFGSWGSICAVDYAPFFADAVEVIDSACEQFDPEG
ncbi:MAG: hypothetical protein IPH07_33450 [Deltaproteobacteria bacterium]|nr:hypothetical protein [Deltaproteobacteria bacterium]MBK8716597.1 hypothetical protein [Deltaproteobacteria bacterium]MBP7289508.1 hypothetical protein [Nannocystaceae bacterium]